MPDDPLPIEGRENPAALYSLEQVAIYAGRSYRLLREYYSFGYLPDPEHTKIGPNGRKHRMFTLREAQQMRAFFDTPSRLRPSEVRKLHDPRRVPNGKKRNSN